MRFVAAHFSSPLGRAVRQAVVSGAVAAALVLVVGVPAAAAGCAPSIGSCAVLGQPEPQGHGVFRFPQAIGFSPGGTQVFVGDQYSSVVQKFSIASQASGPDLATWRFDLGGYADSRQAGRLGVVGGVATDRSGHLFVLDSENDRVQVYDSANGTWLGAFGQYGGGEGQFDLGENTGAGGIAVWQTPSSVPNNGNPVHVFVADQRHHRIQRFTVAASSGLPAPLAGTSTTDAGKVVPQPDADWVVGSFGDCHATGDCTSAAHNFHLNYPQGVSVNPADWTAGDGGRIYIADDDNHRVLVWRDGPTGPQYAGQVGRYGTGQSQFRFPYDVGVDWHTPNHLYVADNNNHRLQQFDAGTYAFLRMWGRFGFEHGNFEYPRGVAALDENPTGGVYVADSANNRVQGFEVAGGKSVEPFGIAGRGPGYVSRPWGAAVDARGDVYVADSFADRIQKLSADGTYLGQWGYISPTSGFAAPGSGDGEFEYPRGVAHDQARDRVWVADTSTHRVQEFAPDGTWLATYTWFSSPYGIAADPSGAIYVADTSNDRVRRWDGSTWTTLGANPGFASPRGVAAAGGGVVYVADLGGGVWRFSGAGWSKVDGAPTQPGGVWVDRARSLLYVTDRDADRVMRLDLATSGSSWESWGANGTALGDLIQPAGLTTDAAGVLLVADAYNNRIQRWTVPLPTASDGGATSATLSMSANATEATALAGGTAATYAISFTGSGFTGSIDLAVTGCPRQVTCSLGPDPVTYTGTDTSTLTATAGRNATAATKMELTITASATGVTVAPIKVLLNVTK